jgi:RNA polymerase sigma factor (sigma-70 family)
MSGGPLQRIVGQLRQAHEPDPSAPCADAELLARWVAAHDQAAFTLLVSRHAPMVLDVCRRILRDEQESEDAAQAAFFILARKAGSIGRRQALAGWLYRVAYRAALQSRARLARRPTPDESAARAAVAAPDDELIWRDLRPVLDEEVSRLPAKCRVPFVLCHLEGRTNEDAARELGCPVGTVLSRLSRARERLRTCLARRGVTLSAAALTAGLVRTEAAPALVVQFTSGSAVALSPAAAQLAEGIMRTMLIEKVRHAAAAVVLVLVAAGVGAGWLSFPTGAAQPPVAAQPEAVAAVPPAVATPDAAPLAAGPPEGEAASKKLKEALLTAARKTYEETMARYRNANLEGSESLYLWSRRWLEAQLDLAAAKDDRIAAYREHLDRMRSVEKIAKAFANAGQGRVSDASAAEYYRTQAEIWLEQAKAK